MKGLPIRKEKIKKKNQSITVGKTQKYACEWTPVTNSKNYKT
jgi:hypothetical protein